METAAPRLQFKHLQQLIAISEAGSIRRAAERLSIAQPALSRSIREMERELDVKLLERSVKGTELTKFGRSLVSHAKVIETNLRFAAEEIEDLKGNRGGLVRIGTGPYEGHTIAHIAIARVMENRPEAQISITQGDFHELVEQLSEGDLDIMLGPTLFDPLPSGLTHDILAYSHPIIAVRANHPFADRNEISMEELSAVDWVVPYRDSQARVIFDQIFLKNGVVPPTGPVESGPLPASTALMLLRDLVVMMPRHMFEERQSPDEVRALPIDRDLFALPIQLTTRESAKLSPTSRDLVYAIRQVCREAGDRL